MATSARRHGVFTGLALLAIGVLFLLENLTDWDIPWGGWWPVILIAVGISNLVRHRSWFGGLVLIALGGFFFLSTQDVWDYTIGDIWRFWPVILIVMGAKLLFGRKSKRSQPKRKRSEQTSHQHMGDKSVHQHMEDKSVPGDLDITSVFGNNRRHVTDQNLAGGQVVSVFASTEINLLDANLADGEATLEVNVVFGGAQIRLPDNWTVDLRTTNLLGGVHDERDPSPSDAPVGRLTLTGTCLFGGIQLKS